MEYAKNPPNKYLMEDCSVRHFEENRTCWDSLEVCLNIAPDNTIIDFSFDGKTAIVTTACASIFGENIIGIPISDILSFQYSTIREMVGIDISPRRQMAATLGLLATRNAIHKYLQDGITDDFSDVLPNG